MKIPVLDQQDVTTAPLPDVPSRLDFSGVEAASEAKSRAFVQGASNLSGAIEDGLRRERLKADDASVTDGLTAFQRRANDGMYAPDKGVMNQRGENAMAAAEGFYEDLNKQRDYISQKLLTNDAQRREFAKRAGEIITSTTATVEHHVGQQKVAADEATLRARQEVGLNSVQQDYRNDGNATVQYKQVTEDIHRLSMSPEDAAQKMADWKSQLAATRIQAALDHQDYQGAEDLYVATKDALGVRAEGVRKAMAGVETKVRADAGAGAILRDAAVKDASGQVYPWVDQLKAHAAVKELPDSPLKEEVSQRVDRAIAENHKDLERAVESKMGEVLSIYNTNGHNPYDARITPLKTWLNDPLNVGGGQAWRKFEMDLRADTRAEHVSTADDRAAEKERQKTLLETFKGEDPNFVSKANIDQYFLGKNPTDNTKALAKLFQNKVTETIGKGGLSTRSEFDATVRTETAAARIKTGSQQGVAINAYLNEWWVGHMQQSDGKPPERAATLQAVKDAIRAVKSRNTGFLGIGGQTPQEALHALQPGATPAPPPAPTTPKKTVLPAGVKLGKDGKPYQKGPKGWVPFSG